MALHKKIQEIVDQTRNSGLPPLSEQPLHNVRMAFLRMRPLQGDARAIPKVETFSIPNGTRELPIRFYYSRLEMNQPIILYFHAGGYVKGDLESPDSLCRELAHQSRAIVVSVGYRLAPENHFPGPVEDGECAYMWIKEHAEEMRADPSRIALCGDSSGGNLAAALAHRLKKKGEKPLLQVLIYPLLDYTFSQSSHAEYSKGYLLEEESLKWYRELFVPKNHNLKDPELSPLFYKDFEGLPPALIITAEYDPTRDEGEKYAEMLRKNGVETTLHRYEGVTHGFFQMAGILEEGREAMNEVATALRRAFYS